jgi:nucleolar protein 56
MALRAPVYLVTTWFGSFLLEDGKVVKAALFPKDPGAIADRLQRVEDWQALDEERQLVAGLDEYFVHEPRLERIGGSMVHEEAPFIAPEDHGFDRALLHEAMMVLGKRRVRKAAGIDAHLAQAIGALDDMYEAENLLFERLDEWYGLHFPELSKMVRREKFVDLIASHGNREMMALDFGDSVGGPLPEEERQSIMQIAAQVRSMAGERARLSALIEKRMRELAPNVTELTGPIIGARLVSLAGGLDELAKLPSSTVQLLGAEKALFRHLKDHTKPPKHGVLFQHPLVHQAPYWQRGSISRAFASKIAIAARADFYSKRMIAEQLKADLDSALAGIRDRKSKAPPRKPRRARERKPRKRRR